MESVSYEAFMTEENVRNVLPLFFMGNFAFPIKVGNHQMFTVYRKKMPFTAGDMSFTANRLPLTADLL